MVIRHLPHSGEYTISRSFTFEFMEIRTLSQTLAESIGITVGCWVETESHEMLDHFEIRCDGYICEQCPTSLTIGRGDDCGWEVLGIREDCRSDYLQNDIEFNVLMNDVLLSPEEYMNQYEQHVIRGTQALSHDSLIALIRARTYDDGWYEQCFDDFFFNFTVSWETLDDYLSREGHSEEQLLDNLTNYMRADDNEDVVAGYSVLQELVREERFENMTVLFQVYLHFRCDSRSDIVFLIFYGQGE